MTTLASVSSICFYSGNCRALQNFLAITGISVEENGRFVRSRTMGGEKHRGKKESQNFLTDDLHPSREKRTAKPLVCSFFRHVSSPCCQTTDSARPPRSPSPAAPPLLSCISTRNFPFFFIILFIFLANHSDPAAVCLPMQMQRVGASCSPVSSVSVSPTLASCTFYNTNLNLYNTASYPPILSSSLSPASV